eukprot:6225162-Amphidinium_carterae.1
MLMSTYLSHPGDDFESLTRTCQTCWQASPPNELFLDCTSSDHKAAKACRLGNGTLSLHNH